VETYYFQGGFMSDQDLPAPSATGADGQSPPLITTQSCSKKRRSADTTIKDQDAVRDYLTFKQTTGLMSESEKRLLDKIASVCGISIDGLQQNASVTQNPPATQKLTRKA
jgi:hypothetical protein